MGIEDLKVGGINSATEWIQDLIPKLMPYMPIIIGIAIFIMFIPKIMKMITHERGEE